MKTAFIINPVSGTGRKKNIRQQVANFIAKGQLQADIMMTEHSGHGKVLAKDAAESGYEVVVAVGGDGTVNEVAGSLRNTGCALGIIPAGSGNGLARHFSIPMNTEDALKVIGRKKVITIDTMEINGKFSVNISGIGFDAHVAGLFASHGKRGFITYSKLSLVEFFRYQPLAYTLSWPGGKPETNAFIIVFANASQWGNHAKIAPGADATDGLITVGILKKLTPAMVPGFVTKLFSGKLADFKAMNYLQAASITVTCPSPVSMHIDGEPAGMVTSVSAVVVPASLKIVIP